LALHFAPAKLIWPLLTSGGSSPHLAMTVALRQTTRSPRVLRTHLHAYLCRIYAAASVQVSGFASIGLLTPLRRLYPLAVRQSSALPAASSGSRLAMGTLAVRLTLPLAGCVEDLHLLVSAPCRAHQMKRGSRSSPSVVVVVCGSSQIRTGREEKNRADAARHRRLRL
jgi:hypothetical protein